MSILKGISRNLRDAIKLGPTFPLRHVSRTLGRKYHVSAIKGAGVVSFRPGSSDAQTITDIFANKAYDLSGWSQFQVVMASYHAALATGRTPVIIDAGANVGAGSIWFARQFPRAVIIAVEPDSENAEICRLNTCNLANVEVVEAAIGSETGLVALSNPGGRPGVFRRPDARTVAYRCSRFRIWCGA
jgi:hypothetical protein